MIKDKPQQQGYVWNSCFFYNCICQVRVVPFSAFSWKPFTALTNWKSDVGRCHILDHQTVSSEVHMSTGHTFRDCQHSDEPENSWGNTHNQELPKSISKWREKTLANVKVSLVAFPEIFLSFHTENWSAVFSQETKPGQQCCRACHIDKVRSTRARNRLQQLTALWEFTHTNKSSAAEEVIIQCYLCWTMGLPIPMASDGNVSEQFPFWWVVFLRMKVWLEFTRVCYPTLPPIMKSSESFFILS